MIKAIIIDDEAHARESLTNVIHQYCQEITVIGSGENVADAIALINRFSPDIVFLDIDLPNGNGFTLFEHITHSITIPQIMNHFNNVINQSAQ